MKFEEPIYKHGDIRIRKKFCLLPYTYQAETKYIIYWLQNIWIEEKYCVPHYWDNFETPYWRVLNVHEQETKLKLNNK